MTIVKLRECAAYWQQRLNIPEWKNITVNWAGEPLHSADDGGCWWSSERLKAEITVAKRSKDQEHTIVHELLHLVIDGHEEWKGYNEDTERAINRIATALLEEHYRSV